MYIVFLVLIVIACVLLTLTVLAQSPKGGMAANFGVSNQVMGVRQTTDFLEKFTWGLSITLVVLCLAATMTMPRSNIEASKTAIEQSILDAAGTTEGNQTMALPAPAEAAETATEE
jgi:preprotein translocase subunit SecG